jgi:hypothetical protein
MTTNNSRLLQAYYFWLSSTRATAQAQRVHLSFNRLSGIWPIFSKILMSSKLCRASRTEFTTISSVDTAFSNKEVKKELLSAVWLLRTSAYYIVKTTKKWFKWSSRECAEWLWQLLAKNIRCYLSNRSIQLLQVLRMTPTTITLHSRWLKPSCSGL